jgi:hypothetical protein
MPIFPWEKTRFCRGANVRPQFCWFSGQRWMMKDAKLILEEFWDIAESRCAFDLKNNQHHEGYILDVENDHLRFGEGGPMATEEYLLIPVQDVDLTTLAYWDKNKKYYMDAEWNEEQGKWTFKPSRSAI